MAVTLAQLERITSLNPMLVSYALVVTDVAIAQAEETKQRATQVCIAGRCMAYRSRSKILLDQGFPTAAGMAIHKNYRPAEDGTVVRPLREAGAVPLGKLKLTEGAYSDYHPPVTPPNNPWNAEYWPGISSSGPATATAAGMCYGLIATDTGGSIRWPSAANGVTGLKPSWGRVSRHGAFELAATLDHAVEAAVAHEKTIRIARMSMVPSFFGH